MYPTFPVPDYLQSFVGWRRYGWRKWQPVCSSDTEPACRALLAKHQAAPTEHDGEGLILPAGETPVQ